MPAPEPSLQQLIQERTQELLAANAALKQEIATRQQTEHQLARSLSLVQATLESTMDGILVVDREGKVAGANRRFAQMWRIPESIMNSGDDQKALSYVLDQVKDPQAFLQKVQSLYEHPDQESFDVLDFKDGRIFERYSKPQMLQGEGIGRVWSFRDVTQQRRLEMEAVQNGKMVAMGQLAAGVAHDLNNPMTVILGFAQSALAKPPDDFLIIRKALEAIERESQRCRTMVQNMLLFSRRQTTALAREPLASPVQGALALVQTLASARNVELFSHITPDLDTVEVDSIQIERLVINLCTNAIDAMPGGGILNVSLLNTRGGICLRIQDTGSGIPKDVQSRMFEPFFTTKPVGSGTGLGLSLVRETADAHHAAIDVDSEPGKGTTFSIVFPVADSHQAAA